MKVPGFVPPLVLFAGFVISIGASAHFLNEGVMFPLFTFAGFTVSVVLLLIISSKWYQKALIFPVLFMVFSFTLTSMYSRSTCNPEIKKFAMLWLAHAELFFNKPLLGNGWCRMENIPSTGVLISGLFRTGEKCSIQDEMLHAMGVTQDGKVLNKYCPPCGCYPYKVSSAFVIEDNKVKLYIKSPEAPSCVVEADKIYTETILKCRREPESCRFKNLLFGMLSLPHYLVMQALHM